MRYVEGDLCDATQFFIAHGCNAQGVMGSGVAKALRSQWPEIFEPYKRRCDLFKDNRLELVGKVVSVHVDGHVILNLITQQNYGKDGKKYASYIGIADSILASLMQYAEPTATYWSLPDHIRKAYDFDNIEIAIPQIGSGLGGLKWQLVEELLKEIEERYENVEFVVYTPKITL